MDIRTGVLEHCLMQSRLKDKNNLTHNNEFDLDLDD